MIIGRILRASDGQVLLPRVRYARNWLQRARGLLAQPCPQPGEGMLLSPCNSVHMLGMRYPLDIVFLSGDGIVTSMRLPLRPWRMAGNKGARTTLELRAGEVRRLDIQIGERLLWEVLS